MRNWVEARLRSARYRAVNAARLIAISAAVIFGVGLTGLIIFGRLGDAAAAAGDGVRNQFAALGFAIQSVDVTGADAAGAMEAALATGAAQGQPLFGFDPRAGRAAVEALPWVRSAAVARLWPDRIAVVVEPRIPFALWQIEGDVFLIDRDGVALRPVDPAQHPDMPLVVARGAAEEAAELLDALARYPDISSRVTAAIRVGGRRWNLRLAGGMDIKLPEDEAGAALALLAAQHAERGVLRLQAESIDLRQPGEMIVRAIDRSAARTGEREA